MIRGKLLQQADGNLNKKNSTVMKERMIEVLAAIVYKDKEKYRLKNVRPFR
jgi:hypothetical protein